MTKINPPSMRRLIVLLLAAAMSMSVISCGEKQPTGDATLDTSSEAETEKKDEYGFTKEYEGSEIRVLNIENIFSYHCVIDPGETTGDSLSDAQYKGIRKLEDLMGITWKETNISLEEEFRTLVPQMISADEDNYDIIYENTRDYFSFSSQGFYHNLLDYPELQLGEDWFISAYNDSNRIGDKLYTAFGYSSFTIVDAISCLLFNQDMVDSLGMSQPYDLVRNGTWTLARYSEYLKAAANLNGDDAFKWKDDGSCIWGVSYASNIGAGSMKPCGEMLIDNVDGQIVLTAGTERFYDVFDKLSEIVSAKDGTVYLGHYSGDDKPGSYVNCFEAGRALFGSSEVAKANRMRHIDMNFGILPSPKFDEAQERYYCTPSYPASGVSIPVTCKTPNRSAAVGNAVNRLFYNEVWPTFREVTLETKNMRNEDSIEMLDIILNSLYPNVKSVFSVAPEFFNKLDAAMRKGGTSAASIFASYESKLNEDIAKINSGE